MDQFEIPGLTKEEILECMHSAFKEAITDLLEFKDVPYSNSFRAEMIDAVREAVEEAMPHASEIEDAIAVGVKSAVLERNER